MLGSSCKRVIFGHSSKSYLSSLTRFAKSAEPPAAAAAISEKKAPTPQELYVVNRRKHAQELSGLRKQWKVDFEARWKREEAAKVAERKRIVVEQAIKLREKRAKQLIVQERVKKEREIAYKRYMGILERNTQIIEDRRADQQERYRSMVEDLVRESECWITKDNLEQMICEDLFKGPCTTGLITGDSQHWRYEAISFKMKRTDMPNVEYTPEGLANRVGQVHLQRKQLVRDFLGPMVGSGEDREKFGSYVDSFVSTLDKNHAFDDVDLSVALGAGERAVEEAEVEKFSIGDKDFRQKTFSQEEIDFLVAEEKNFPIPVTELHKYTDKKSVLDYFTKYNTKKPAFRAKLSRGEIIKVTEEKPADQNSNKRFQVRKNRRARTESAEKDIDESS